MNVLGYEPDSTDVVAFNTTVAVFVAIPILEYTDLPVVLVATMVTGVMLLSIKYTSWGTGKRDSDQVGDSDD